MDNVKVLLKTMGYGIGALCVLAGLTGSPSAVALGLGLLAFTLLASNAWGLRARFPHFNSEKALHRRAAYAGLIIATLIAVGILPSQTPQERQAHATATATALRTTPVRQQRHQRPASTPATATATATAVPTATPVTARRLVGAPAQRAASTVVLGASEAAWKARLGPMMPNTGGGVDGWFPCPARPQQAGVLVMVIAGRVTTITGQSCPGQVTTLDGRIAQARVYFPPDSVRQGTVSTEDGPAVVYRSRVLARQVPRDLFLDCDSAPVTAGTFVLNPRSAGHDWALTVGSCG